MGEAYNATYDSGDISEIVTDAGAEVGIETKNQAGLIGLGLGVLAVVGIGAAVMARFRRRK